jgi:hypothetical protein
MGDNGERLSNHALSAGPETSRLRSALRLRVWGELLTGQVQGHRHERL